MMMNHRKKATITDFGFHPSVPENRAAEISGLVAQFIVAHMEPVSVVERTGFRNLIPDAN